MAAPGPSRIEDEDVEMMDAEYKRGAPSSDHDDQMDLAHDDRDGGPPDEGPDDNTVSVPAADEDGGPGAFEDASQALSRSTFLYASSSRSSAVLEMRLTMTTTVTNKTRTLSSLLPSLLAEAASIRATTISRLKSSQLVA